MKDNISDFPGYYVTVDGKVYSRKNNRHGYLKDYHLLKTKYTKHDGRPYVTLRNPKLGIRRLAKVHRLVALAYIPNPENKPCVCHKDNNPLNNHVDNLYWGTQAENMQQCIRDGRYSYNRTFGKIGQNSPTSKYSNRLKLRVFRYKRRHPKVLLKELSNKFKMPISVISKIVKGIDPITKP